MKGGEKEGKQRRGGVNSAGWRASMGQVTTDDTNITDCVETLWINVFCVNIGTAIWRVVSAIMLGLQFIVGL